METTSELAELRKEVATLKAQMAELKKFLHVYQTSGPERRQYLTIRCTSVALEHPYRANNAQGGLYATEHGPYLSLYGDDKTARAVLEVKDNKPCFRLYNDGLKPAVVAALDKTDHAYVAVLDHGKPRAALKATEPGGIVTVTHDDGFPRASLRAEADHGVVSVKNADMKTVGQLTSKCALGSGGALLIHTPVGKPSVVVTSSPYSGFIGVHDAAGELIATVPGPPEGMDDE